MVSALSTGHQIGLATTGALFIIFSLVSSFVLPRRNANFPGRGRNWYLLLCAAFFIAMMGAVFVFGKESKGAEASAATGDPVAGKAVFMSSSCGACHTFQPAGTTAKVGPDLDDLQPAADKAGQSLDDYIKTSITDPNAYITPGYKPAMPQLPLTSVQVDNLVAFLTAK